jgi:ribosomal protein L13
MPKNRLSESYLKNLKIFRGPTHDFPNLPQFAPMRFIENPLTEVNMEEL